MRVSDYLLVIPIAFVTIIVVCAIFAILNPQKSYCDQLAEQGYTLKKRRIYVISVYEMQEEQCKMLLYKHKDLTTDKTLL